MKETSRKILCLSILASCGGVCVAGEPAEGSCMLSGGVVYSQYNLDITSSQSMTCSNTLAYAFAYASTINGAHPACGCTDANVDGDAGSTSAFATAESCYRQSGPFGAKGTATSSLSCSANLVSIATSVTGINQIKSGCSPCFGVTINLAGGSAGAYVEVDFEGDATFSFTNAFFDQFGDSENRLVAAALVCLDGETVAYSGTVSQYGDERLVSMPSGSASAGTYSLGYFNVIIDDSYHDVNGDARFNQDDVDYLSAVSPTSALIYTERFDFDDDGDVDSLDIEVLQCFVDACLDARRVGDANCDNLVDCDDLLLAGSQSFSGEYFTSSDYVVGFDVDLDGDNDSVDKEIVRNRLLSVEPAEYSLDGELNFFDVNAFLTLYNNGDLLADTNGDGAVDFFDVAAFLNAYNNPNCLAPGS